jgi:HK97 gp10 family phage protein
MNLKSVEDNIKIKAMMLIEQKIKNIYDKSQSKVPVKTGYLKASWFKNTLALNEIEYKLEFGYGAYYAKYVDLGTSRMEARNFFTPFVKEEFGVS